MMEWQRALGTFITDRGNFTLAWKAMTLKGDESFRLMNEGRHAWQESHDSLQGVESHGPAAYHSTMAMK